MVIYNVNQMITDISRKFKNSDKTKSQHFKPNMDKILTSLYFKLF